MHWNIPPIPKGSPPVPYNALRWLLLIIIVGSSSFYLLAKLKDFGFDTEQMRIAKLILISIFCFVLFFTIIFIISIAVINFNRRLQTRDFNDHQGYWSKWAQRKLPLLSFSAYLPSNIDQNLIKKIAGVEVIATDKYEIDKQVDEKNLIHSIVRNLLNDQFDIVNNHLSNKKIDIFLNTTNYHLTADTFQAIWLESAFSANQLGDVVKQNKSMTQFFTEFYTNSSEKFALIIALDNLTTGELYSSAWLIHNADYLLDKKIPILAYLPRFISTSKANLSKSIKLLSNYQILEKKISDIWFSGVNQSEQQQIIKQLYEQKYYSSENAVNQIDLRALVGGAIDTNDWFNFTCILKYMLMLSNKSESTQIIMKQQNEFIFGLVMGN
ncbi:hypothetical protein SAMN02583745_02708 [Thorsellia anophelis DSM 18579]|uniref:Uncharacterized protein n=1 Tax=Thorsellia anophelis DSM 18579 TaxID=1123402 RepID=A0A1I0FB84_9GAMM|nr:hypothetical protein SAMN02583745_02708 [Thorsellia anophelis DSM 18579]